jgi:hypothetical protein
MLPMMTMLPNPLTTLVPWMGSDGRTWRIHWRWGRRQLAPWLALVAAGWQAIARKPAAEPVRSRWLIALSRINFVSVYGLLSDLLW